MKTILTSSILLLSALVLYGQTVIGVWENYHPDKQSPLARIEIYQENERVYARVVSILDERMPRYCKSCQGEDKDRPIVGMDVIWELKRKNDRHYKKGRILDPSNGKTYKCFIKLEDDGRLKVRAYAGIRTLGKTQYWSKAGPEDIILASK